MKEDQVSECNKAVLLCGTRWGLHTWLGLASIFHLFSSDAGNLELLDRWRKTAAPPRLLKALLIQPPFSSTSFFHYLYILFHFFLFFHIHSLLSLPSFSPSPSTSSFTIPLHSSLVLFHPHHHPVSSDVFLPSLFHFLIFQSFPLSPSLLVLLLSPFSFHSPSSVSLLSILLLPPLPLFLYYLLPYLSLSLSYLPSSSSFIQLFSYSIIFLSPPLSPFSILFPSLPLLPSLTLPLTPIFSSLPFPLFSRHIPPLYPLTYLSLHPSFSLGPFPASLS